MKFDEVAHREKIYCKWTIRGRAGAELFRGYQDFTDYLMARKLLENLYESEEGEEEEEIRPEIYRKSVEYDDDHVGAGDVFGRLRIQAIYEELWFSSAEIEIIVNRIV